MGILSVIKAPVGVQLNRVAFLLYAIFFAWPLWCFRHTASLEGSFILASFVFCSLLGLGYSFVRISRSRWILAVLGLSIPTAFWTSMCMMVFSRPAWWEWPLVVPMWFSIPVALAVSLFRDKKTSEYFTTKTA
jgi:hypothetical protein